MNANVNSNSNSKGSATENSSRQGASSESSVSLDQVRPNMLVHVSGKPMGTVDSVDGDKIKLKKRTAQDGKHHWIPLEWISKVEGNVLIVDRSEDEFRNASTSSGSKKRSSSEVGYSSDDAEETESSSRDMQTLEKIAGTWHIPPTAFLGAACGSVAVSLGLQVFGKKQLSNFVGQWVPTILLLGLYNEIVRASASSEKQGAGEKNQSASRGSKRRGAESEDASLDIGRERLQAI